MRFTRFYLAKSGAPKTDYEDAYWVTRTDEGAARVAIADGATESSFARLWARLLVQAAGRNRLSSRLTEDDLAPLRDAWHRRVWSKQMPWYAEQKASQGAFSTILGFEIDASGTWAAFALGDSCLFHVRDSELLRSFPILRWEDFASRPVLIPSVVTGEPLPPTAEVEGEWRAGDEFYFMTDALACWFLRRWELRSDPLDMLRSVEHRLDFAALVDRERGDLLDDGSRLLRNDDVTFIRLRVQE